MDVHDPVAILPHKPGAEKPHEAGEADEVDLSLFQLGYHSAIEGLAAVEFSMVNETGFVSSLRRLLQTGRFLAVADYKCDFAVDLAALAGVHYAHHVGASPADQNADPLLLRHILPPAPH